MMNPFLATDGYKTVHKFMYRDDISLVYSNFTPRSNKYAPKGCDYVISFGQQMVMKQIQEMFDKYFFKTDLKNEWKNNRFISKIECDTHILGLKNEICQEIKKEYSLYLGYDYDVSHIEALWDLGYLPIEVKTLPEGSKVSIGVPVLTIKNTLPEFFWLTNFLETMISTMLWKPITSATLAFELRKTMIESAKRTDKNNVEAIEFMANDFSMRGMGGMDSAMSSGLGHLTSFKASDTLSAIYGARKYYNEKGFVMGGVPATEHSIMCANADYSGDKPNELENYRTILNKFPTGLVGLVSDTWDLWGVITKVLPELKDEIMSRDGKLVIRPDSGDPADILCGLIDITSYVEEEGYDKNSLMYPLSEFEYPTKFIYDGNMYTFDREYHKEFMVEFGEHSEQPQEHFVKKVRPVELSDKGVVELLWDIFGGVVNEQGYKVLDLHIGVIYGDAINLDRLKEINFRLESKGFASTNWVAGVGSFTYQYNTRDTFGFAMKATYVEINGEGREIFKDPITDDGTKKSAKGLLSVRHDPNTENYVLFDQQDWNLENTGYLQTIFKDGKFVKETTLTEIRERINKLV